ncbi:MAG: SH3 domain-containing protein, partial [Clostridia bacterium]|nr:SH3 domain-containing protein [Clostridia bacterium]
ETMEEEHWEYEYGAASEGEVDCSGAFDYAAAQFGRPDVLHSSNRIARLNCPMLLPISAAKPGYAAFRWRKDFETAELEEKYSDGLGNFKHVGLVSRDGKHVLHAKGEKYGFVCEKLDSSWQYVAALNFVDYSEEVQQETEAATVLYQATISTNEDPLRVRAQPKTGEILGHVDKGCIVDVLKDIGDGWPLIRFNELEGYVSGQYLTPVSMTEIKEEIIEEVEVETPDTQKVTIIDSRGNRFEPVGDFRVLLGSID